MYLQIKKIEVIPDKFSSHLKITMVGSYDENGKFIKWIKLSEIIDVLKNAKITFNDKTAAISD